MNEIYKIIFLLINILLGIIIFFEIRKYNPLFFKIGITVYKKSFQYFENNINNDIGKEIIKDAIILKIVSDKKLYFISHNKNYDFTSRLKPFIFGECNIVNNSVNIIYKISILFITIPLPLILYYLLFNDYKTMNVFNTILGLLIFTLFLGGCAAFFIYLRIKSIENDINEYFIN